MRVISSIRGLQAWRRKQENQIIGFVPTMGALHKGHLSLIHQARRDCSIVVVSIFVNPLQFGPAEDFSKYPRPVKSDQQLCREAGVDVIFSPSSKELYPQGFETSVAVRGLTQRWEGEARPTHFDGVTTVVTKLLNLVHSSKAYFGQKDYQQLLVIKKLVQDLNINTKIVRCSTIRESDGLALSSRNRYLSEYQRKQAVRLSAALRHGIRSIKLGQQSIRIIQRKMKEIVNKSEGMDLEYLSICDASNLEPLTLAKGHMVLLGAARLGDIRLIDNMLVNVTKKS